MSLVTEPLSIPKWEVEIDGKTYEAETATVESFHLGYEDHGMFTAIVSFVGPAWGQGLPAPILDRYNKVTEEREPTLFGGAYIIGLVSTIGSPEQSNGRRVVVFREKSYGDIKGVSALNNDGTLGKPFMPRKLFDKYED